MSYSKNSHHDEGLFVSALIYVTAVVGVLALFVVPVYLLNGPTVLENAGAQGVHLQMSAARRNNGAFPVARLEDSEIVDPARVAELNAKVKSAQTQRASHVRRRQARVAQRAHRQRQVQRTPRAQVTQHARARRSYAASASRRPMASFRPLFSLF